MKRRPLIASLALMTAFVAFGADSRRAGGNRLEFLAGYLALSDTQKTQAQSIFDAAESASETARGQLTAASDALKAAVKTNAPDSDLDRLGAAVGAVQGQMAALHAKASAKFYALLTADQKTKFDALGDRGGMGPGGGRRPGGGMGQK